MTHSTTQNLSSTLTPAAVLVELVQRMLAENGSARPISLTTRLADMGVTSIQMVTLMLAIEAQFNLTIAPSEITPENFLSISSIATLIERIAPEAPAAR